MFKSFKEAIGGYQYPFQHGERTLKKMIQVYNDVFEETTLDQVISFVDNHPRGNATIGTPEDARIERKVRDAQQVECSSPDFDPLRAKLLRGISDCLHKYIIKVKLNEAYDLKNFRVDGDIGLVVYEPGSLGYRPHNDANCQDWKLSNRLFSVVSYFNDDFSGGDLYFPDLNHRISPQRNSCVIFPSSPLFTHGASSVIRGRKVISPGWWGYELPNIFHRGSII